MHSTDPMVAAYVDAFRTEVLPAGRNGNELQQPEKVADARRNRKHSARPSRGAKPMNVLQFIVQNHIEVLELTGEHLWLVGGFHHPGRA